MLVEEISFRITQTRGLIRKWFLLDSIGRVLIGLAVCVVATYFIDRSVPDLPRGIRLLFFLSSLSIIGYLIYRHPVYSLKKPIHDDDIAACLERVYPQLKDRLISSLQLMRSDSGVPTQSGRSDSSAKAGTQSGRSVDSAGLPVAQASSFSASGGNSREMIEALVLETNQIVQPLDFNKILDVRNTRKLLVVILGIIFVLATFAVSNSQYTVIWFNRLLGGNMLWPKETQLKVILDKEIIAKGQDTTVEVIAEKGNPGRAYIHYEFETGERGLERMNNTDVAKKFRFDFLKVNSTFRFFVRGGDDQTQTYTIRVLTPPRVEKMMLWYEYPAYTGLAPTDPTQPEIGGMVRALIGTRVKFTALANIPLKSASARVGKNDPLQPVTIQPDIEGQPKKITGELTVTADSEYTLELIAENSLVNLESIKYPIKALIDESPRIKIIEPRLSHKLVTPNATILLKVSTKDDYGINRIALSYKILTLEAPEEIRTEFTQPYNNAPYGTSQIDTNYPFQMSEVGVKEGDIIRYFIEAEDNCTPQAHLSRSGEYRLTIVNSVQLQRKIEETELRLKIEVDKLKKLEEELARQTTEYLTKLADKNNLEPEERRGLQKEVTDQRRITQKLEDITREFDEIISDVATNKLWDTATSDKLKAINNLLRNGANDKSPQATESLTQALNAPKAETRTPRLTAAQNTQTEITQNLADALQKMGEWEDYQEVVRILREIIERHKKFMDDIRKKGQ